MTDAAREPLRLFETSRALLCIIGFDHEFILVNPASKEMLGFDPEELQGHAFTEFIHPEDRAATLEATAQLQAGVPAHEFESRFRAKDGSYRVLSWRSSASIEHSLIYITAVDVTDQVVLRKELARHRHELERSNEALDEFAYVASHDLRAPLRDIDNLASWLEEDVADLLPAESLEHLAKIRMRIDRMERLLTDLMRYSRIGRKKSGTETIDLAEIVRQSLELSGVPESFSVEVDLDVGPFEGPSVRLTQVLTNLISNAVKHHVRDDGQIRISARDKGAMVHIEVADDGPGIDSEYHERVFELFRTMRAPTDPESSGVGLALVRKIVTTYGGSVEIVSEPGHGATFIVDWPRRSPHASNENGVPL